MRDHFGSDCGRQLGPDRKAAVNLSDNLRTFCGDCSCSVRRMSATFSAKGAENVDLYPSTAKMAAIPMG